MKTGALYIRVSSEEQTEFSPDAQRRALLDYAAKNDIIITGENIFVDEGISGRKAEKRPAFMRMIASAKKKPKPFEIILCHKFDRFSRSREDSIVYKSLLRRECGIQVVSITEYIEDDKFAVILEAMLEAMAEYYSLNLSDEVKKGMSEKALRGQYQAAPPFGYEMINKKLKTIPEQKEIYLLMVEKLLTGMRPFAISKYVNSLGFRTKRGNFFESRTITGMLRNSIYCGIAEWDGIKKECDNEAFISCDEYDKILTILNNYSYHRKAKPPETLTHWLTGLLYCSSCGGKLASGGHKHGSFQCNNYSKGRCCVSHHIVYHKIAALVTKAFEKSQDTSESNFYLKPSGHQDAERLLLEAALLKINSKEARAKTAYLNGIDSLDEYQTNKAMLGIEKDDLLLQMDAMMYNKTSSTITCSGIYDILSSDNFTKEEKHTALASICKKIIYDKQAEKITIVLFII